MLLCLGGTTALGQRPAHDPTKPGALLSRIRWSDDVRTIAGGAQSPAGLITLPRSCPRYAWKADFGHLRGGSVGNGSMEEMGRRGASARPFGIERAGRTIDVLCDGAIDKGMNGAQRP